MPDSLLESIAEELRQLLQMSSIQVRETPWGAALHLPPAEGADHRFVLSGQRTGEYYINVESVGGTADTVDSDLWHLHQPFELADFGDEPARLEAAFRSAVLELVRGRTRIRRERGWMTRRLYLEREVAPNRWTLVYRCTVLRWTRRAPRHEGG